MHAEVVRNKDRRAARLAGILAALVMALTAVFVLPTAANAAKAAGDCGPLVTSSGQNWGGVYWCAYGKVMTWNNNDSTFQVYVVAGAGRNVFTRLRYPKGGLSHWVNLGGHVYSYKGGGSRDSLEATTMFGRSAIKVLGTDKHSWCNVRESNGRWTGWKGPQSCRLFEWNTPVL